VPRDLAQASVLGPVSHWPRDGSPRDVRRTMFTDERLVGPLASFVHNLPDTNLHIGTIDVATTVDPDLDALTAHIQWLYLAAEGCKIPLTNC
jgi:hypothetical protein